MPEFETLDFSEGWESLEREPMRQQLEEHALPAYLSKQRWFASKGTSIARVELTRHSIFPGRGGDWLLATFRVRLADGRSEDYFLPLAIVWDTPSSPQSPRDSNEIIARIQKGDQSGVLRDALSDPRFIAELVRTVGKNITVNAFDGTLRFSHTHAYFHLQERDQQIIEAVGTEQSNSSILIAQKMVLKAYRKLERGIQPELEIGRYLTDVANYGNTPPLLGSLEHFDAQGQTTALAIIQGFVANQGDGWSFTLAHLKRIFTSILQGGANKVTNGNHLALAEQLGLRVAELHRALAIESGDPAFQPEPGTESDVAGWKRQIQNEAESTLGLLASSESMLAPEQRDRVQALLDQRGQILNLITRFELHQDAGIGKTRFHGDLHLGQVLVAGSDFYIIDFEGEPARPFAERRAKHSPLRDVAGILRSLNYAAWSALFEAAEGEAEKITLLQKPARDWEFEASNSFKHGYQKAIQGCSSCPADPNTFGRLLNLFILEKALYEIRYELANRPSWLRIPVEGILSLLAERSA